ncbi:energy transducer TonB [Flavobacteriales bacterium]|nr:energy transducer TonB [Flavobacteriales bacterium]
MVYDDQIVAPKTLPKTSIVFNLVELEKRPQFPGGEAKMYQFIAKNIQYTHQAKEASIQGKVYIQFVVEIDGELTDIKIIRGVDSLLDTEVLKMVKLMPN